MAVPSKPQSPFIVPDATNPRASRTATSLRIGWAAVPGALSYVISLAGDGSASTTGVENTFTGLTANTGYVAVVIAVNLDGSSPPSDPVTFFTRPATPAHAPSLFPPSDTSRGPDSLKLTWDDPGSGIASDLLVNGATTLLNVSPGFVLGNLASDAPFVLQVRARDDAHGGDSDWSVAATIFTRPATPNAPALFPPPDDSRGPTSLKLTWNDPGSSLASDLLIDGTTVLSDRLPGFVLASLGPNVAVTIQVRARDDARGGPSFWSPPLNTLTRPPTPPDFAQIVFGFGLIQGVWLDWGPVAPFNDSDHAVVEISRSVGSGPAVVIHQQATIAGSAFVDLTVQAGMVATYTIHMVVGTNVSFESPPVTAVGQAFRNLSPLDPFARSIDQAIARALGQSHGMRPKRPGVVTIGQGSMLEDDAGGGPKDDPVGHADDPSNGPPKDDTPTQAPPKDDTPTQAPPKDDTPTQAPSGPSTPTVTPVASRDTSDDDDPASPESPGVSATPAPTASGSPWPSELLQPGASSQGTASGSGIGGGGNAPSDEGWKDIPLPDGTVMRGRTVIGFPDDPNKAPNSAPPEKATSAPDGDASRNQDDQKGKPDESPETDPSPQPERNPPAPFEPESRQYADPSRSPSGKGDPTNSVEPQGRPTAGYSNTGALSGGPSGVPDPGANPYGAPTPLVPGLAPGSPPLFSSSPVLYDPSNRAPMPPMPSLFSGHLPTLGQYKDLIENIGKAAKALSFTKFVPEFAKGLGEAAEPFSKALTGLQLGSDVLNVISSKLSGALEQQKASFDLNLDLASGVGAGMVGGLIEGPLGVVVGGVLGYAADKFKERVDTQLEQAIDERDHPTSPLPPEVLDALHSIGPNPFGPSQGQTIGGYPPGRSPPTAAERLDR